MGEREIQKEWIKCEGSCHYFVDSYCYIYDGTKADWVPFKLWDAQANVLYQILDNRLIILLKARQLGATWLVLCWALWRALFHPAVTILLFSRRDDEAIYLLANRLRGIYDRLPDWAKAKKILISNDHVWQLSNGSAAYGFPTTAGDSYTASIVIADEFDLVQDQDRLINAVKPTIDGGGNMILLSRSEKSNPTSTFKRMYRAAKRGENGWFPIFMPWWARPERNQEWYEAQKQDVLSRTSALDDLYQQYPATDEEALQPPTLTKRVPVGWLTECYTESKAIDSTLGVPMLTVYEEPHWTKKYVIGADPAEGNPTSDPSSMHVLDLAGNEVAKLADRVEPVPFAELIAQVSRYYNEAEVLVERNNHGHAVIGHLTENTQVRVITGWDGSYGWHTTTRGKALMWTILVNGLRDHQLKVRSESTYAQLNSIDGKTLRAPEGMHDDEAISYALASIAVLGDGDISTAYQYS